MKIVPNKQVVLKFRKILLEGLSTCASEAPVNSTTKIAYTNISNASNYKGIFLQESFVPVNEMPANNAESGGTGFYRLLVWGDKNTGLQLTEASDIIADFFEETNYVLEDDTGCFFIDYKEVGEQISSSDNSKLYIPITIYYRKFQLT